MKKASTLYITLIVLSVLMVTLVSLVSIILTQAETIFSIGNSVVSFYAAESGAEEYLYRTYKGTEPSVGSCFTGTQDNAFYETCRVSSTSVSSVGTFRDEQRVIWLSF